MGGFLEGDKGLDLVRSSLALCCCYHSESCISSNDPG